MAKGRNWDALKDSTRHRYERAGISRADYMSGMSLKTARGHGTTPERPGRRPTAGQEQYWINRIVSEAFSDRVKYKGAHDISEVPEGKSPPTIDQIEYALTLSEFELEALAKDDPDFWWLFYH